MTTVRSIPIEHLIDRSALRAYVDEIIEEAGVPPLGVVLRLTAQRDAALALHEPCPVPERRLPPDSLERLLTGQATVPAYRTCVECSNIGERSVIYPCATARALGVTE